MLEKNYSVAVIGAGPAGLTAGYLLAKRGVSCVVIEEDPQYVGGISKTVRRDGFHFDIGGHRFFSKSEEVERFWTEILPRDMLERPRSSQIYYRGKFFTYPLKPLEALIRLGPWESFLCGLSFLKAKLRPIRNPVSFQDWVTNQFGARLFRIFFKTYTEKVWGMSCRDISADWAAQRIKGLSLYQAVKSAIRPRKPADRSRVIKTLIDSFRYPRKGPGMMWEACAHKFESFGGRIIMGQKVKNLSWDSSSKEWLVRSFSEANGRSETAAIRCTHVISSAPLRDLIRALEPSATEATTTAAKALRYRDFLTVTLILKGPELFSDNWIYIHDPNVKVGRIQNFKSWSPEMVPDPQYGCYGLEYFCFEGDGIWSSHDQQLIDMARQELQRIGLGAECEFVKGHVVRQKKAYPVYDERYQENVEIIRREIEARYANLHPVGRNGMHKYNNQDHAIMTAMLTVENIIAGRRLYDVWQVNQDAEYHESGIRSVPTRLPKAKSPDVKRAA